MQAGCRYAGRQARVGMYAGRCVGMYVCMQADWHVGMQARVGMQAGRRRHAGV